MNKKLTIAIPTYNRPEKIKMQVELLLPQLNEDVELIVMDNCSPIPVENLFSEEQKRKFKLVRNKVNIGADANIAKCFQKCDTKWLIVLGDDDPVEDYFVETLLLDLRSQGENTVFLCYDPESKYIAKGLNEFATKASRRYWCLFWMSACVYNISLLKDYMHFYHYSISTMQPGIILLCNVLNENPQYEVHVMGKRMHKLAGPDIHWNRDSFVYASLFVFDVLWKMKQELNATLFSTITGLLYRHTITISKNEKNLKHSLRLISDIRRRRGVKATFKYDLHWYVRAVWHAFFRK